MIPDYFYPITVALCLAAVIAVYFANNPLKHSGWFMLRRFINWFPLGLTYAFLCMGRYNLIVAKGALGTLMSKSDLGIIFGVGTLVYATSFLVNGPLIDKKLGGKCDHLHCRRCPRQPRARRVDLADHREAVAGESGPVVFAALLREHVFPKLWLDVHHQGQGLLVSRP
jgi:hypothetical protein